MWPSHSSDGGDGEIIGEQCSADTYGDASGSAVAVAAGVADDEIMGIGMANHARRRAAVVRWAQLRALAAAKSRGLLGPAEETARLTKVAGAKADAPAPVAAETVGQREEMEAARPEETAAPTASSPAASAEDADSGYSCTICIDALLQDDATSWGHCKNCRQGFHYNCLDGHLRDRFAERIRSQTSLGGKSDESDDGADPSSDCPLCKKPFGSQNPRRALDPHTPGSCLTCKHLALGTRVEVNDSGKWHPAVVRKWHPGTGRYDVVYDNSALGESTQVPRTRIRLHHSGSCTPQIPASSRPHVAFSAHAAPSASNAPSFCCDGDHVTTEEGEEEGERSEAVDAEQASHHARLRGRAPKGKK